MSDYTIVNLREVEDAAPKFGLPPEVEARFAKQALGCKTSAVSLQSLAPGTRSPFGHRHKLQEELYVILEGSGSMKLDDDIVELRQWDAVRVDPGTMRAFEAGPDGIELLAFGGPIAEESDGEIVPGWWSD
jgi:quercetin dioxygenase-like cupin family protein